MKNIFQVRLTILLIVCSAVLYVCAQDKIMIYDEERGVIFVDKKEIGKKTVKPVTDVKPRASAPVQGHGSKTDLHIGRKKDPPDVYFKSGLEFFRDGDYEAAQKNFLYADSVKPQSQYKLWVGKTYRQLSDPQKMMSIMNAILAKDPQSDVADDALFEIAFYYHTSDDYQNALDSYTQLAEQYPFGQSFSNGMSFLAVAKDQRGRIKSELLSLLSVQGYSGEDLVGNVRSFQKANGLEATGEPDRATMAKIREKYQQVLQYQQKLARRNQQLEKNKVWLLLAGVAGLGLLGFTFVLRIMARSRIQHLFELEKLVADMDKVRI